MNKQTLQNNLRWLRNRWVRLSISIVVLLVMVLNGYGELAVWVALGIAVAFFALILWLYGDLPGK